MNLFGSLTLRAKLLAAFLSVAAVMLVTGGLAIAKLRSMAAADTLLYEKVTAPLGDLVDITENFQRVRINVRDFIDASSDAERETAKQTIRQLHERTGERMDAFQKTLVTDEDRTLYAELGAARKDYGAVIEKAMALDAAGKDDEAKDVVRGAGKKAALHYQEVLDKLVESKEIQGKMTFEANREKAASSVLVTSVLLGLGLAASIALGLFITARITRQLGEDPGYLHEVASNLAAGNLDGPFRPQKKEGGVYALMLGIVASMRKQLAFSEGVMRGIAVPFSVFSDKDATLYTNQQMLDIMEIPGRPQDHYGKQSGEFIWGEKGRETLSTRALREKKALQTELAATTRGGKTRHVQVSSAPFFDDKGAELGTVSIWLDQTESVAARQAAEQAAQGIQQAAGQLEKVVEVVGSASEELSAQVEQSARGAQEQSARVGETATAMGQMNATVLEVARNASQAADSSVAARTRALEGARVVAQVVAGIGGIQAVSLAMKQDMDQLGRQAQGIGQVMNVISDIADQTNLLALNAAIEAARAGDAGRGFAVVADEVRKLAEKTMQATKEVGQAVHGIQEGAKKNLGNVERAVESISQTTALAGQSGEALNEIVRLVELSADQVHAIAAASEEQSAASEEISRSIEDVSRISSETADAMGQSAQAVGELAGQAQNLRGLIERMKTA